MTETAAFAGGGLAEGVHRCHFRVYYEDTDAGGVVYYANYLKFAERGRTEYLRALGIDQSRLADERGLMFVVRRSAVDFRAPARLDDLLEVETRVTEAKGASLEIAQVVAVAERPADWLARIESRIACIDRAGRPARLPAEIKAKFVERGAAATAPAPQN